MTPAHPSGSEEAFTDRAELLRAQESQVAALAPRMIGLSVVPLAALALGLLNVFLLVAAMGWSETVQDVEAGGAILALGLVGAVPTAALAGWRLWTLWGLYRTSRYWRHVDRFVWARQLPAGNIAHDLATPYDARDSERFDQVWTAHRDRIGRRGMRFSVIGAMVSSFPLITALLLVAAPALGAGTFGAIGTDSRVALTGFALFPAALSVGLVWVGLGADGVSRQRTMTEADFDHAVYAAVRRARGLAAEVPQVPLRLFGSAPMNAAWGALWFTVLVGNLLTATPEARVIIAALVVVTVVIVVILVLRRRRLHLIALDEPDPTRPGEGFPRRTPVTVTETADGWMVSPDHGEPFEVPVVTLQGAERIRDALSLTRTWVVVTERGPIVLAGAGVESLPLVAAARARTATAPTR